MTEHLQAPPDEAHVENTCRIGKEDECRYLTLSESGWCCEKLSELKDVIDARVARGKQKARGDNCDGMGSQANGPRAGMTEKQFAALLEQRSAEARAAADRGIAPPPLDPGLMELVQSMARRQARIDAGLPPEEDKRKRRRF